MAPLGRARVGTASWDEHEAPHSPGATLLSMKPSDWIALAALGVSALALIVGPVIGAHLERKARTETARRETYVRVLALLRQRADELDKRALGWPGPAEPTDNDEVLALLFLYASPANGRADRQTVPTGPPRRPHPGATPSVLGPQIAAERASPTGSGPGNRARRSFARSLRGDEGSQAGWA